MKPQNTYPYHSGMAAILNRDNRVWQEGADAMEAYYKSLTEGAREEIVQAIKIKLENAYASGRAHNKYEALEVAYPLADSILPIVGALVEKEMEAKG